MRIPCRCWTRARSSAMIVSSLEEFTMRWDDFRRSDNVEDSRGDSGGFGGGGMGIPVGGGGLGIGTIVVLGLIGWALGIDPSILIGGAGILTGGASPFGPPAGAASPRRGR